MSLKCVVELQMSSIKNLSQGKEAGKRRNFLSISKKFLVDL